MSIAGSAAATFFFITLFAGTCNSQTREEKNKALENYTGECMPYVMFLVEQAAKNYTEKRYALSEARYHEAATANCLCQQGAKGSDQNLCKNSMGIKNSNTAQLFCSVLSSEQSWNVDGKTITIKPQFTMKDCLKIKKPGWD